MINFNEFDSQFWNFLEKLVAEASIVIDRPCGSSHPRYPDFIYPVNYGYLDGTTAVDGNSIDTAGLPDTPARICAGRIDLPGRGIRGDFLCDRGWRGGIHQAIHRG